MTIEPAFGWVGLKITVSADNAGNACSLRAQHSTQLMVEAFGELAFTAVALQASNELVNVRTTKEVQLKRV